MHIYWEHSGGFAFVLGYVFVLLSFSSYACFWCGFLLFSWEFCKITMLEHMQIEFKNSRLILYSRLFRHLCVWVYMLQLWPFLVLILNGGSCVWFGNFCTKLLLLWVRNLVFKMLLGVMVEAVIIEILQE